MLAALALAALSALAAVVGPGCAWVAKTPCGGQVRDGEAILGALLPLHKGPGCSAVSLRGAQLEAALRAALDRVNRDLRREGISISARILDTCAQPEEAVKAAMRALVAADQTCLHPPLFLGLLGPEDPESLEAALKVTGVFDAVHVLPWGPREEAKEAEPAAGGGVLHVARLDPAERAQGVMLLVRRLRWPSFLLVHAADALSEDVATELQRLAVADPDICLQRRVLQLAEDGRGDSDVAWAISKDNSGGVVVVAESLERGAALLSRLSSLPRSEAEVHVLLAVRQSEAGSLSPSTAPKHLNQLRGVTITLLHDVSPSGLVPGTQRALLAESPLWLALNGDHGEPDVMEESGLLPESQDASVGAMSIGVQLMGAALRAAHRIKCPTPPPGAAAMPPPNSVGNSPTPAPPPGVFCPALHAMAPDEWRSILQRVTAFADTGRTAGAAGGGRAAGGGAATATKLRFGMDLRSAARVLVKRSESEYFEKAGLLVGGRDLQLESSRFAFPAPRPRADEDCGVAGGGTGAAGGGTSSQGSSAASTPTTSPPQRSPPGRTKSNRALDRHPRTTPPPREGSSSDVDWSWILGGSSSGADADFYQMLYMLAGAAAVMLLVFLLCFYIVYRSFRVKTNRQHDSDSNSSPKSRASRRSSMS